MKDYSRRYYNEANRGEDTSRHVLSNGNILYVFEGFDIVGARSIDGANLLFGFLCCCASKDFSLCSPPC